MPRDDRERLRRDIRARRRRLSAEERDRAARRIARIVESSRLLKRGQRVAFYLAYDGEADLSRVIASARQRGCLLYLPAIVSFRSHRMVFRRFEDARALAPNRYGILEPVGRDIVDPHRLDLVFAPLVAFDDRGGRLGSGAGFYDRALRHLRIDRRWRRPRIIGVGYDFQRIASLDPAPWDVSLDAVITETSFRAVRSISLERP